MDRLTCTLTVVYFPILQNKLVLFLSHGTFTVSFCDNMITTGTVKWLQQTSLYLRCVSCENLHLLRPPLAASSHVGT